ncbi:MAG TPA: class I SAM-dependent methyltransferase [Burkholderiaceae bacterium]|nr:class I SAM-dependent methyltransferase [Burkholderiaceae bacterium]
MSVQRNDNWAAGDLYEPYVGRWSRLAAKDFLQWLALPAQLDWLDVGCGTGALTQTILQQAQPQSVKGIDPSAGFVDFAKAHVCDPKVTFDVGDAQSLPVESDRFDVAASGLVLNFVPKPSLAAQEMARVVRAGGTVAAYVWDYAGKMELMRYFWDAAAELDPTASNLVEATRFPMCQPPALTSLFQDAGLNDVRTQLIDVPTTFKNFDDYWTPFLGGQGPAPAYAMSLAEERRIALRDRIRETLPIAGDGSIALIARAWAVRGQVSQ